MEEPWFTSERSFWVEWRNEILYKRHRHNKETYFFFKSTKCQSKCFFVTVLLCFLFLLRRNSVKSDVNANEIRNLCGQMSHFVKKQHKPYKTNVGRNCFWASVAIPAFLYFLLLQSKKIVLPKIDCNASKSREKIPELTLWTNIHFHTVTKHIRVLKMIFACN